MHPTRSRKSAHSVVDDSPPESQADPSIFDDAQEEAIASISISAGDDDNFDDTTMQFANMISSAPTSRARQTAPRRPREVPRGSIPPRRRPRRAPYERFQMPPNTNLPCQCINGIYHDCPCLNNATVLVPYIIERWHFRPHSHFPSHIALCPDCDTNNDRNHCLCDCCDTTTRPDHIVHRRQGQRPLRQRCDSCTLNCDPCPWCQVIYCRSCDHHNCEVHNSPAYSPLSDTPDVGSTPNGSDQENEEQEETAHTTAPIACSFSPHNESANLTSQGATSDDCFTVDSGATIHCISNPSLFTRTYPDRVIKVRVANGDVLASHSVGDCDVQLRDSNNVLRTFHLSNVVYHPQFSENLLSVHLLARSANMIPIFHPHPHFIDMNTGDTYPFKFDRGYKIRAHSTHSTLSVQISSDAIHRRFLHAGYDRLRLMPTHSINFPTTSLQPFKTHPCPACASGASRKLPFPASDHKYEYFGQLLSSDLLGPLPFSRDGFRYILCIIDACTRFVSLFFLPSKHADLVRTALNEFLHLFRHYLPTHRPTTWHCDNGGEFTANDLDSFCREFAINRSFSVPYAPSLNARAERFWGTLLRILRVLLADSGLPEKFWTDAARHANLLNNMMPSRVLPNHVSPYEMLYRCKPDVRRFRRWGCLAFYHLPPHERRSKISPRAVQAVHLGIDPVRKGYLIYVPSLNVIRCAYHLVFNEDKFISVDANAHPRVDHTELDADALPIPNPLPNAHAPSPINPQVSPPPPSAPSNRCDHPQCTKPRHSVDVPHSFEDAVPPRDYGRNMPRSSRNPNPNYVHVVLDDVTHDSLNISPNAIVSDIPTPSSFQEAKASPFWKEWLAAMRTELTTLLSLDTWTYVPIVKVPQGRRVTKSRWVFKVKLNPDGTVERFKARFVVCGYSQVLGQDYFENFSATLRATSFRTVLAIASGKKLLLVHFDVTNAFTQSDIDAEIYVMPPQGFESYDTTGELMILKLNKSLYGTKQASRLWQIKLTKFLTIDAGFLQSATDPCLFSLNSKGSVIIVAVYVDDIVVAHNGVNFNWFKDKFLSAFKAKFLGPLAWFLSVHITQSPTDYTVVAHQTQYIHKLLDRFIPNFHTGSLKHTQPCDPLTFPKLTTAATETERARMSKLPYLQLVGSLLYLSTMTRPDIAYHMSVLCSLMHNPSLAAYAAALNLLQYVGSTVSRQLRFNCKLQLSDINPGVHSQIKINHGLHAYSDSSWHQPDELGYNMFGFIIFLFGAPIAYVAKRLKVIALSSAEAEYSAMSNTCKELTFIRQILNDLGLLLSGPIILLVDNQAAISICINSGVTARNKHFTDAVHNCRHDYVHQKILPIFVSTKHQLADGFTKALIKAAFNQWAARIMNSV